MEENLKVYKASAGSGKTFTLAVEYISILMKAYDSGAFRNVLAVTFTNKATAEMKERILQQLYGISRNLSSSEGYLQAVVGKTSLDEATIRERAGAALRAILHDYDRFRVETIDSFFQSLLMNLAHELQLSSSFMVDINDRDVTDAAVEKLIEDLQYSSVLLGMVLSYVAEKIEDNRRWDIRKELKDFAQNLFRESYLQSEEKLRDVISKKDDFIAFRRLLSELKGQAKDAVQSCAAHIRELLSEHGMEPTFFSNGRVLETYLKRLEAVDFTPPGSIIMKYISAPENWLTKAKQKDKAALSVIAEYLQPALVETEAIRMQMEMVFNSATLTSEHMSPLQLLNAIGSKVKEINDEANRFMLAKTPILLNRLVSRSDTSFVFERMGATLRNILIDEFQDTSTMQWASFRNLLLESLAAGNRCLLVGDVKQSIYRWRNGDWSILENIKKHISAFPVEITTLDTNYRSEANIISFNNRFFTIAAQKLDSMGCALKLTGDEKTIERLYSDVVQNTPPSRAENAAGYVSVRLYDDKKEDDWEAMQLDEMVENVRTLHEKGLPYEKIAILVRGNKSIQPIVSYFGRKAPEIPLVSDEAFLLRSSLAVNMIIAALRCLDDEDDNIASAFLAKHYAEDVRGQIIASSDIWSIKGEKTNAARFALLPVDYSDCMEKLRNLPLYELVESIYRIFEISRLTGQDAYVFSLFDSVLAYMDEHTSCITDFLTYWDDSLSEKAIPSDSGNGLRVLTIHKSKGLQYHTVILPYCHWAIEKDRLSDLLWCEPKETPYDFLPLVPVSTRSSMNDSVYADDYKEEHLQRRIENLNLLYVAFTRAEKNLFVLGKGTLCPEDKMSDTGRLVANTLSLMGMGEDGRFSFGELIADTEKGKIAAGKNRLEIMPEEREVRFCSNPIKVEFCQSNGSREFTDTVDGDNKQDDYIRQGNLLHSLFSYINTPSDVESALLRFEQQGLIGNRQSITSLRKMIERGLRNPHVERWFSGEGRIFRECTLIKRGSDGKALVRRPDRVIDFGNEVAVVDFKFGRERAEYRLQVAEYLSLLKEMGYENVKGYLWYVYTDVVEEITE